MKRTALTSLAALLLVGCQVLPPPPPPPPPRIWNATPLYAVQTHLVPKVVAKQWVINRQWPMMRDAHFTSMRFSLVPWELQANGSTWNFAPYDAAYTWMVTNGITPLFMLQNPRNADDVPMLKRFATQAAQRWKLALFELCNEPDANGWDWWNARQSPKWSAFVYWQEVAVPLAQGLLAGNPDARIATGGTSGVDLPWQQELAATGAFSSGLVTAIGIHSYSQSPVPVSGCDSCYLVNNLISLEAMPNVPKGFDIWVTEYGNQAWDAPTVDAWLGMAKAVGLPLFSMYEAQDNVVGGVTQTYGLLDLNYAPKGGSTGAYAEVTKLLAPPTQAPSPMPTNSPST